MHLPCTRKTVQPRSPGTSTTNRHPWAWALFAAVALAGCNPRLGLPPPDRSISAEEWAARAQAAHDSGATDEALILARYAVAADPRSPRTYAALAGYLHAVKDFSSAAEAYKMALQRDPQLREAKIGLGWVLLNLGEVDQALRHLPPSGRRFDELHLRGALYVAHGDIATGTALLRSAKALADRDPRNVPLTVVRDIDCRLAAAASGHLMCPLGPVRPGQSAP